MYFVQLLPKEDLPRMREILEDLADTSASEFPEKARNYHRQVQQEIIDEREAQNRMRMGQYTGFNPSLKDVRIPSEEMRSTLYSLSKRDPEEAQKLLRHYQNEVGF